ncbi:hypothetical protein K469DRAFT_746515 [Zopfia rhizophila CBS 207.26]|uniref:NACHT domain-containing protein n=1 Tax=Zopfia rhizophila CBS 207.26 TaxID=1314779 RepID=A0A6A6EG97_9PEZI|nr:hypothetical protein K469DRAFT_746515 [Zopfia rhizophila CBS 207.26]
MAAPLNPVQAVFENAIRDFKASLKDDALYKEILKTTTIDEVYDATDKLQNEQRKKGHLRHLSKIEPFLEGLRGYASVIEVFVQAKPNILALIWGPIKLLLQWASTLKQSLDAIIGAMADIGILLPEFQDVYKLFSQNKLIKEVLALFFKDILDFYLVALKFFSLPRWKMFFESLWPKHRGKIQVVTDHIKRHTLLMRNEVRLEHIQQEHHARVLALEKFESIERSNRRQEYYSIKTDISPRSYEDIIDRLHGRICVGTGKWLIRDATFLQWLDMADASTRVLWLQGIPGAGKTFLSSTVVDKAMASGRTIFAFLSYTSCNTTSALSVLHSFIFQLTSDDDNLQAVLCQSSREKLKSNITVATSLLATLLACAGPAYIAIDGIDEIDEMERGRLLQQLLDLSKDCKGLKILVSSRPEADITTILKDNAVIIRVDNRNAGSIQAFVTRHTQTWFQDRGFLSETRAEIAGLLAPLASNSKGMFLYAKIVLNSIEHLEIGEIHNELEVLPETLDDAYARVLTRINKLNPPAVKDKARKLLGWIGCSPTPLTIQEMEQALIVNLDEIGGRARVLVGLNIIKICGPTVELVDDYVQFVHFTVKEYLFSPRISGFIDHADATLSLAMCCITYLGQAHHDTEMLDEEISQNILSGTYRFHDFSMTMWLEVVERFVFSTHFQTPPDALISVLEMLVEERSNDQCSSITEKGTHSMLEPFKTNWPQLHSMLCEAAKFRQKCSKSEYNKRQGLEWTNLDPLTISHSSIRIYEQFDQLLCRGTKHEGNCNCFAIHRHHGQRPFKCGFLSCSFRRHGFETRRLRDLHIKYHDRPWKCSYLDCEFAEGGFLSRKMRDEHLDRFHREEELQKFPLLDKPDADEIQPLLFDLVKADKVDVVKTFLPDFDKLQDSTQKELQKLAAFSGSPAMLDLIVPFKEGYHGYLIQQSIQGQNMENFKHLCFRIKPSYRSSTILTEILRVDSEEMFEEWESRYTAEYEANQQKISRSETIFAMDVAQTNVIQATAGNPNRECLLLQLWGKISLCRSLSRTYLGDILLKVASSSCSLKFAKYLIDGGAEVDHRRSSKYRTPLQCAAQQTTAEAAELMKFLLFHGADPDRGKMDGKFIRGRKNSFAEGKLGMRKAQRGSQNGWVCHGMSSLQRPKKRDEN